MAQNKEIESSGMASPEPTDPSFDPCYNYTALDNNWRSIYTPMYSGPRGYDDTLVEWKGWYRLYVQGQSAQMSEWCLYHVTCGGYTPLTLNGSHPQIGDGIVTRGVIGSCALRLSCNYYPSNPIKVKACPGNYYVYKLVKPDLSIPRPSYCAVSFSNSSADPCYNYTILNDPWRSTNNTATTTHCDTSVNWVGWYRLFYQGQSAKMPESCVSSNVCGTTSPLWLSGSHPQLEDGVVFRPICGSYSNLCCYFHSSPIRVKACPGNYYVYEFIQPNFCNGAYCIGTPLFYPFGLAAGDTVNPRSDDGSSSVIYLQSPFSFFGRSYSQLYVNNNGHLTFNQTWDNYAPTQFDIYSGRDMIAPFWADLDNRGSGVISYNQYTNGNVLSQATKDINQYFPGVNFTASWIFVATWDKVAHYSYSGTETSFQVVLISDGNFSFVLLNYGYIAPTSHRVEAGYDTNHTDYFVILWSDNKATIQNLRYSSNVNVPGRWAFLVECFSQSENSLPADPCYNYVILEDTWRSTNSSNTTAHCDTSINWMGWYRLFYKGQSAKMPESCVSIYSCGTHAPLWLNGSHPGLEDGVVVRPVCGNFYGSCCIFQSPSIRVKACPGNYYVYEFVKPNFCYGAYCIGNSPTLFYLFGLAAGDTVNPRSDDGSSSVIYLQSPFSFFGRSYSQLYVNNNGHLTFNQAWDSYAPTQFDIYSGRDMIAPFWTDLDNRGSGVISYNQYTNGNVLSQATNDINQYFPGVNFTASWVFVATWHKVAHYSYSGTETSFQVVLISDGNFSFVLMNYGDIAPANYRVEAGYDTNLTDYFTILWSVNKTTIQNLKYSSNVNVPGRWAFLVNRPKDAITKDDILAVRLKVKTTHNLTDTTYQKIFLQQFQDELRKRGVPSTVRVNIKRVEKTSP
ncbi:uncharacterized protein [Salminus brasiliensis]|uniref:uncharacterized protein n=1 Tax=Salminus brasiliensis TaxID=930266 RepID=UPI003B833C36